MAPEKTVIDASVVIKWFVQESDSGKALLLRNDHIEGRKVLIIPELTFLEVLNTIIRGEKTAQGIENVLEGIEKLQLVVERHSSSLLRSAARQAREHHLTMYDAVYVAVARAHSCRLITANRELAAVPGAALL